MKKHGLLWLFLFLLWLPATAFAQTETYVLPQGGIRILADADWQLLAPSHLPEDVLTEMGLSAESLAAAYLAEGTLAEFFLPAGGQIDVSLTVDAQSQRLRSVTRMTDAERDALCAQFAALSLYEDVAWVSPEHLRMRWTVQSQGAPLSALCDLTVRQGAYYRCTAYWPDAEMPAAMERALDDLVQGMAFLGAIATPAPTSALTPTATPTPTPAPTPGIAPLTAQQNAEAALSVSGLPAYTQRTLLSLQGVTEPNAVVQCLIDDTQEAQVQANSQGAYALTVSLPAKDGLYTVKLTATRKALAKVERVYRVELSQGAVPLAVHAPQGAVMTPSFSLEVQTLPGAQVQLRTPNDTLRARANAEGRVSYTLSMRREGTYAYTLTVALEGYLPATQELTIERRLNEQETLEAFRRELVDTPYVRLAASPKDYAGRKLELRGRIAAIEEVDGYPCLLLYTSNPGTGVWRDPVWVVCDRILDMKVGTMLTLLGEVRGDAYEAAGTAAPVVEGRYYLD